MIWARPEEPQEQPMPCLDALDGAPGQGLHLLDPQDAAVWPDQAPEHGGQVAAAAAHVQHLNRFYELTSSMNIPVRNAHAAQPRYGLAGRRPNRACDTQT